MSVRIHIGRRLKPNGLWGGRDRAGCPTCEEAGRATVTCHFPIMAKHRGHGDARQHPAEQQENQRCEIFPKLPAKGDTSFRPGGETAHTGTRRGGEEGHETTFRPSQVPPALGTVTATSLLPGAAGGVAQQQCLRGWTGWRDPEVLRGLWRCPRGPEMPNSSEASEGPTQTRGTQGCWRG